MAEAIGYNLAFECLQVHQKAFDLTEARATESISSLDLHNSQSRKLQQLIAAFTHAKKNKEDADFSKDDEMRETIQQIYKFAPEIFGHYESSKDSCDPGIYVFKLEDIDTFLTLLDSRVKDQVTEINQITMNINHEFEQRIQFTESAQKTLDMQTRHAESILGKTRS